MPSYRETGGSSRNVRMKSDMIVPSTSKAQSNCKKEPTQSPVSPVGRIAKRNAIKLNEMDLSGRSPVYSENFAGMIPLNLEVSDLDQKFPVISKLLDSEESLINADNFNALQKAIEELLVENVDNQKTIHGEITYMNTGEYPTIELNNRPMPTYQLRPRTSTETAKRIQGDESLHADLGLNSSPEEEDEDQPSILDVPQRFWNWSREYLRHITEEYLSEFKDKIVDRFSDEEIQKYLSNDHSHTKPIENGVSEGHKVHKKVPPPRLNGSRDVLQTPLLSKGRVKRRPAYLAEETMPTPKIAKRESSRGHRIFAEPSPSKVQSLVAKVIRTHQNNNGVTPKTYPSNGMEMEANEDEEYKDDVHHRLNGICDQKPNGFHPSPLSNGTASRPIELDSASEYTPSKHKGEDLRSIGKALASLGVQKGILPKKTDDFMEDLSGDEKVFAVNGNNNLVVEEDQESMDEVSQELRRKQKELAELYLKTKPNIIELYERIQAEYALYETSRRLDITDDKVFELGAKYERLHALNREQRQESKAALEARERAVHQFYRFRQPTTTNYSQKPNTPNRKQSHNCFD